MKCGRLGFQKLYDLIAGNNENKEEEELLLFCFSACGEKRMRSKGTLRNATDARFVTGAREFTEIPLCYFPYYFHLDFFHDGVWVVTSDGNRIQ